MINATRQSREIRDFLFSQYFSDGLRITLGVLLPSLILAQSGNLNMGVAVSLGALCVSIADNPGPFLHRRNGMFFCLVFCVLTALLTGLINFHPVLQAVEIALLCFFFSMFAVYGNRASSIGTAALVVMVLNIDHRLPAREVLIHTGLLAAGGIWYMLLSMVMARIRPYRPAQQALGECIEEVAEYLEIKSKFYDISQDTDELYKQLVEKQVHVHHQQDTVRELLFKTRMMTRDTTTIGRQLVLIFVDMVDLFEQTMATHYDYSAIRERFGHLPVLKAFSRMIADVSEELYHIGQAVISNDVPRRRRNLLPRLEKLKTAIDHVEENHGLNNIVLKKILVNLRNMTGRIDTIYNYFDPERLASARMRSQSELNKFVVHQNIDKKVWMNNMNLRSNIFRHSLRVALVCLIGFLISKALPLGHYSYWILLTILVILKPGFSLTKQRNYERLFGTFAGGVMGALIIYYVKDQTALFIILLVFMVLAYSFQRLKYVVSVLFMTPYILIVFSFMGFSVINLATERVLDTFIGCIIALSASYFVFPTWEYNQLRNSMRELLIANYRYLLHVANSLRGATLDITDYKLARKEVYVSSANMGTLFQRMLTEPKSKQRNITEVNKFVVLNHLLSSYTANLLSNFLKPENRVIHTGQIRSAKKSLYILSELIKRLETGDTGHEPFEPTEVPLPEPKNETETGDTLLNEQLELVHKISGDIQKVTDRLFPSQVSAE